ncbi:long-chain fatty acid--CoA ligase [Streptomyces sp. ID38640]|uniref:hypothetical protein n=1 Tax=Streptomyces sp. ID38640 TaxID=1265399 RepID=UPI00140F35F5|nr:hypothetical protein [Streptomyces sp. ID38640]QIK05633.1 long-chain fatty acid--CoA ligase [Streptomyces sp. ID38640]
MLSHHSCETSWAEVRHRGAELYDPAAFAERLAAGAGPGIAGAGAYPNVRAEVEGLSRKQRTEAKKRLYRSEQVKKSSLPGEEWSPESGELTPSLKLQCREIHQKYGQILDGLYTL